MSNDVIRIRLNPEVMMYIDLRKMYIHCPYAHYNECAAFERVPQMPYQLDAVKFRNGPIIKPSKVLSVSEKRLIASKFQGICQECYKELIKKLQNHEQINLR